MCICHFLSIFCQPRPDWENLNHSIYSGVVYVWAPLHESSWWLTVPVFSEKESFISLYTGYQLIKMLALVTHLLTVFITFQCKYPSWDHELDHVLDKQRTSAVVLAEQVEKEPPKLRDPDRSSFFARDHLRKMYQSWEWHAVPDFQPCSIAFVLCPTLLISDTPPPGTALTLVTTGSIKLNCSGVLCYKLFCLGEPKLSAFVSVRTGWKICVGELWDSTAKFGIKGTFLTYSF